MQTTPNSKNSNSPWQIAGITALIVGLGFLLIAAVNHQTLQRYQREGVKVEATVTEKSNDDEGCIGVSYFDKGLLEGGELYLTEICDFVTNDIWNATRKGAHEMVVYLPSDPQNHTIFAASLEKSQLPTYSIGGVLFVVGLLSLGWQRVRDRK